MENSAIAGRVLFVDDDVAILEAHARSLGYSNFEVVTASSGDQALKVLEGERFDVVVSDLQMPGMPGVELLRQIRELYRDLPVILLTGAPSVKTAVAAVEHGAVRYLIKPVERPALIEALQRAIGVARIEALREQALELDIGRVEESPQRATNTSSFGGTLSRLWLAAQPIASMTAEAAVAYELLLRADGPMGMPPEAFLELARSLGQGQQMARVIRAEAARRAALLSSEQRLFLPLDPKDLYDPELYAADAALSRVASRVVLALTERARLDAHEDVGQRIDSLRELGYQIAIDDLGSGYAGLTSLSRFDPDVVKLDPALIRGIDSDPRREALVGGMVATCRAMGMVLIVEGVETFAERDRLLELGCDLMQGRLFAEAAEGLPGVAASAFMR